MIREELKELEKHNGDPLISVTAPMHKTFPDLKENPVRVKNQIKKVREKLEQNYDKRLAQGLLERLKQIADEVDYEHVNKGLGIFISPDKEKVLHLPFEPNEKGVVDQNFVVRDLVFAHNRTVKYWVLSLSEAPTRLFEGVGNELTEIIDDELPTHYMGPDQIGFFDPRKAQKPDFDQVKDEYVRKYFRNVDDLIAKHIQGTGMPVILVGIKKYINFFKEVAKTGSMVVNEVEGNYVNKSANELSDLVWPVIEEEKKKERDQALKDLEEAIGQHRYTAGLQSAWELAQSGRIETLLVERNFYHSAYLSPDKNTIYLDDTAVEDQSLLKMHDAVDDVVEKVVGNGGRVYFYRDDRLKDHGRIAAITRF